MGAITAPKLDTMSIPGIVDGRAARASLRSQLRHLERELAQLMAEGFSDPGDRRVIEQSAEHRRAHLPTFAELVCQRDALIARVAEERTHRAARRTEIARTRAFLEEVRRAPERHPYVRIPRADLGEPGCGSYQVRPKLGIIGMLAGWWQVKLSSGCP
ncbi:hypothetical protein LRS13_22760 [Svornostia abyssi]|uniref:Uncharacterized protein n=1 Tax=Svornostia abyssi TaxID=2898438 RepID=A0ABY5PFN3_9ACTN|nr:hypothetical protein LRS13_22760 [Parviterribacteraceae bacterium J379]